MSTPIKIVKNESPFHYLKDVAQLNHIETLIYKSESNKYLYDKCIQKWYEKYCEIKTKYGDYISGKKSWSKSEQCLLQLYEMDGSNQTISISKNAKLYDLIENISEIFECGNNDISLFLNECSEPLNNGSTIWKTVNEVILKNNTNTLITSMFVLQSNEPRGEYCKIGKTSNCTYPYIKSTKKTNFTIF